MPGFNPDAPAIMDRGEICWYSSSPVTPFRRVALMATYECEVCGMSVNTSCGKCDASLEDGSITLDDGTDVQVSKCPNDHGMIKSPLCCGQDMACTA